MSVAVGTVMMTKACTVCKPSFLEVTAASLSDHRLACGGLQQPGQRLGINKATVDVAWFEHNALSSSFDASSSRFPLDGSAIIYARESVNRLTKAIETRRRSNLSGLLRMPRHARAAAFSLRRAGRE
jgi:hypothetical protein